MDDVLAELNLERAREQHSVRQAVPPDPTEAILLEHLSSEPRHVDEIVREVTMPSAQVNSLLAIMELKGLVRQVGSLRYVRAQ